MDLKRRDYAFRTRKVLLAIFAIVSVALWTGISVAGIIIDSTGVAGFFSGGTDDQVFPLLTTGNYSVAVGGAAFRGNFYGQPVNSNVWIAENGNINFSVDGDGSFFPQSFSDSPASSRIAPFWDDFQFFAGETNQIIDHSRIGDYLAVTWRDAFLFNDLVFGVPLDYDKRITTQVVWFERDMNVNGFDFKKDDIAFGYSGYRNGNIDATIGVSHGSAPGMFTSIPGDSDGLISSRLGQSNLIPWNDNEFLLFRPTANGMSYTGTREFITAVPESSSIFLVFAWMACAFAIWRRQLF